MDLSAFLADESETTRSSVSSAIATLTPPRCADTGGSWADEMDTLPTGRTYSYTFDQRDARR